jgi:hypothetical protein
MKRCDLQTRLSMGTATLILLATPLKQSEKGGEA